jgi:predicted MFS family arabinose efflux permease
MVDRSPGLAGYARRETDRPRFAGAGRLYLVYAGAGAGIVPHMVFFVDMAVRARGHDTAAGAALWLLFGAGAIAGTLLGGRAADRFGGLRSLQAWAALQALAAAAALVPTPLALGLAALLGGFAGIGITAVALARARELAGPSAGSVWVGATASYAVTQAATAFGLTALFAATGSHDTLFAAGLALSLAALAAALLGQARAAV